MIFDVSSSHIEKLDSNQLVELLKKLLHAEAQRAGISLSGISVPLQITVPDGGEDARISWIGGLRHTDYLPSQFTIFQSKATDPGPSGWKKEVWTKSTQQKGMTRKLNEAVKKAISEQGSYIGFTSAIVIGDKYDRRISGIKQGICETGIDPNRLNTIDIYDANKIAEWASQHPAVAVWLNEQQSGLVLRGFQTIDRWGKKLDFSSIEHVEDKAKRFLLGGEDYFGQQEQDAPSNNALTFQQTKERIADYLADSRKLVRILGPSGVGKTRFIFEVFNDHTTVAKISLSTSAIFCDYREISNQIFQVTQSLSESGSSALLIIDECPREAAEKLLDIIQTEGCGLRVLTIGNDDRVIKKDNCLNILVLPADDTLVEGIIRQRVQKATDTDISFINKLCGGYPRIAVLATDNYSEKTHILKSVEDVVERILTGCNINHVDQVRAIECLALFNRLGADEEFSEQFDLVAKILVRQTGDEMYEHLAQASRHHLVDRRGRFFAVQPIPIAAFLGTRRLDLLRIKTLFQFIEKAPQDLLISFFNQWRFFDSSKTAFATAERLLSRDGWLGSRKILNSEFGSKCLKALVHVNPDAVLETIDRVFGALSIEELKDLKESGRYLVWTLEILVFRNKSFRVAAQLLMKLAAAENKEWGDNATVKFKQLFQLHLSGTEAEPTERFMALDEGISSGDERIISICIDALKSTLNRDHFSRSGGAEQIGSQLPLKDWKPMLWREVFNFHLSGLRRLDDIRSKHVRFANRCEIIIASHIRTLLCENLYSDVEKVVQKIATEKGIWLEAIKGVGDWLYFNRKSAPEDFSKKIRGLYDSLIPTDPIQKALLYTKFWSAEIHDPDLDYNSEDSITRDLKYSSRRACEVATEIAADKDLTYRAIQPMVADELHNAYPFAYELALKVEDPVNVFRTAVQVFEGSANQKGIQFIRGMLAGVDKRDRKIAEECMEIALNADALKDQMINIYTAVSISVERLNEILRCLKEGTLEAVDCAVLSYGRGLDNLDVQDILPILDELTTNHEAEGVWTALEIISMYQLDRKELDIKLAQRIKQQIVSPKLLGKVRRATRDGYLFEQLTLLIQKHSGIDDEFAIELSNQITRICQVDNHEVFFALDDPARKIIKILVKEKPNQIWEVISRFFENATPTETHWLENLIGPPLHGSDEDYHNREGVLFGISEADCIKWAQEDPSVRAQFLCHFYPVFEVGKTGESAWHPSLEILTNEFGMIEEFRQALARRFHPRSWWGSIIPYLEVYLKPLKTWFTHSVPEMSYWAKERYYQLEKQITKERIQEKERLDK